MLHRLTDSPDRRFTDSPLPLDPAPPTVPTPAASLVKKSEQSAAESFAFEGAVVAFFVDAADLLGVPKSVAAIYGICFASPAPLSFAEIEQKLDLSKGSISQGLRLLRGVGALKEVSLPTDRVERFKPDIELRKLIIHYFEQRVEKQLDGGKQRIRDIKASIPRSELAAAKLLSARVKSLEGWHAKSQALMPMIKGALRLAGK